MMNKMAVLGMIIRVEEEKRETLGTFKISELIARSGVEMIRNIN